MTVSHMYYDVISGKQEDDPGVPLTFDMLTNPFLHRELSAPLDFHFTSGEEIA